MFASAGAAPMPQQGPDPSMGMPPAGAVPAPPMGAPFASADPNALSQAIVQAIQAMGAQDQSQLAAEQAAAVAQLPQTPLFQALIAQLAGPQQMPASQVDYAGTGEGSMAPFAGA